MSEQIVNGHVLAEKERIVELGKDLSKAPHLYNAVIDKGQGPVGFGYYLILSENGRAPKYYALHDKIPPDTGKAFIPEDQLIASQTKSV